MNITAVASDEPPAIAPHHPELDEDDLLSVLPSSLPKMEFILAPEA